MTIPSILASGNFGVGQSPSLTGASLLGSGSFGSFESFFSALLGGGLTDTPEGDMLSLLEGISDSPKEESLLSFAQTLQKSFSFSEGMALNADLETLELDISTEELFTEIRQEITFFKQNGIEPTGIANIDELASAYTQLGMEPAAAQEKAIRTSVAIDILKQKVQIDKSGSADTLAGIFNALTSHEKSQVLEVVSQRTEVKAQRLIASLSMSQKLSSGDVAMQVLEGKPLLESSTAAERARVLQPIISEVANLTEQAEFAKQKVDIAVAKAVDIVAAKVAENVDSKIKAPASLSTQPTSEVANMPEDLQRTLRKLTGEAPAPKTEPISQQINHQTANPMNNAAEVKSTPVEEIIVPQVKQEQTSERARPEPLFSVRVSENGEFVAKDISDVMNKATNAEADQGKTDHLNEIIDEGLEIADRRIDAKSRAEGTSSMERMAKQAEITTQVNVKVRQLAANGGGQVKMLLNPPQLGEIEISLEINNRAVKGQIVVQTQEVAEQLARDLRSLQQGLADAGLELEKEGISFLLQEQASSEEQIADENSESNSSSKGWSTADADDIEVESPTRWRNVDQLVDVEV